MTITPNKHRTLAIALASMASCMAMAQTDSTAARAMVQKEHANLFGIGHTNVLDTYLSQETFRGTEIRYVSQMFRKKEGSRVSTETMHSVWLSSAGTRGNSNSLLTAMYNLKVGWHYNWTFAPQGIGLKVGGMIDGTLGGTYNTRNSNNPAQARLALSIDPSARLSWKFRIGSYPLTLNYELAMPLVGAAFSPNYGQSYYEIFSKGNYDHNVVVISPFSGFQCYQMLTVDLRLGHTTFSLGYIADIRQMSVNNLKYHQYTHGVILGWKY